MSAKAELARRVLEMLAHGYPVPAHDALQLRNWAVRPKDSMLPLEEIAHRILNQEETPNTKAAERDDRLPMFCEEKARLVAKYNRAALVYSRAISVLTQKKATFPESEYKKLRGAADDACIKCKEARLAFERHMAEHGC
jgi:hypothetical protein